jgi:uncharacterized membrane protein YhhN
LSLLIFIILTVLSAILAIYGKYSKLKSIHYFFKPLTMALIISLAAVRSSPFNLTYKYLILSALIFSLIGDFFLMLPRGKFIQGMLAFLIAHILYILAFTQNVENYYLLMLVLVFIYASVIYFSLYKKLNKLRLPVLLYVMAISIMGWLAVNRYLNFHSPKSLLVLMGGLLFLLSDSTWAVNKFRKQFWSAEIIILGTYFSAQLLLALSI